MKFISSVIFVASLINVEAFWVPYKGMTWNDALGDSNFDITKEDSQVIVVDYETSAEVIEKYHSYGKKVICYFSGGTLEGWRSDVGDYEAVDGLVRNTYSKWAQEKWLDFRKSGIKPLIQKRMQIAVNNKCDALEVDNLDAYQIDEVKNVWSDPINAEETITFAKWLAQTAHGLGISIGLKNIPGLLSSLINDFDFAINESCDKYPNECSLYKDFTASGKAVFGITYGDYQSLLPNLCKELNGIGISLIIKPTQELKQDGIVFNGEKDCGSGFHSGYSTSTSSSSVSSSREVSSSSNKSKAKKVVVVVKTVVRKKN